MRKLLLNGAASILLLSAASCGEMQNLEERPGQDEFVLDALGDQSSSLSNSDELTDDTVESNVDEAIAMIADDGDQNSSAALSLLGPEQRIMRYGRGKAKRTHPAMIDRSCVADEGIVTVSLERSLEKSREFSRGPVSLKMSMSASGSMTRIWSQTDNELACNDAGNHLKFPETTDGLKLNVSFERNRKMERSFENERSGKSKVKNKEFSSVGTREISFLSSDLSEDGLSIIRTKDIKSSVVRTSKHLGKDGETFERVLTVTTGENAPIISIIKRDVESRDWIIKTLESGTLIGTRKNGDRAETSFFNVVLDAEHLCMPISGTIEGKIFKADEEEAIKTYTVEFNGDSAVITYGDGKVRELDPEGCDLDVEQTQDAAEEVEVDAEPAGEEAAATEEVSS